MELAAAKPVIIPDTVVIDHGRVFLSEVFLRAADTLGISVQPAHQLTATDKAIIERTFGSINTLFCQHVAGYTGRDVTRRGSDVDEPGRCGRWPTCRSCSTNGSSCWQCRPHEGLRHPFTPDQAASPNEAYAALVAAAGYVPVALTGEDYIELMPADWRSDRRRRHPDRLPHLQLRRTRPLPAPPSGSPARAAAGRSTTTRTT